jgi:two-component system chemotaxis response regulator CheY
VSDSGLVSGSSFPRFGCCGVLSSRKLAPAGRVQGALFLGVLAAGLLTIAGMNSPEAIVPAATDADGFPTALKRLSVLWIDDEPAGVDAARHVLGANGIDVTWAGNGPEGLQQAAQPFDLIILDEEMPGMSGLEVLSSLRGGKHQTPVMVLTAHATPLHAFEARGLGAAKYHQKPLVGERLVAAIFDALVLRGSVPAAPAPRTRQRSTIEVRSHGTHMLRRQQTTWRPSADEVDFLDRIATWRGVSRNTALRGLVRAAMNVRRGPAASA